MKTDSKKSNGKVQLRRAPNPKKDFYGVVGGLVFLILVTLFLFMFPVFGKSMVLRIGLAMAYALVIWQLFGVYMKGKNQL